MSLYQNAPNKACTDEGGSQEGAKANGEFGGVEQHKTAACTSVCQTRAKRCKKLSTKKERGDRKAPLGSPAWSSHSLVFGTSLTLLVEGGSGMGFFEPQAMCRGAGERTGQQIVLQDGSLFRVGRQTSGTSQRSLRAGYSNTVLQNSLASGLNLKAIQQKILFGGSGWEDDEENDIYWKIEREYVVTPQ